jgi:excisionase family DNA binding protein
MDKAAGTQDTTMSQDTAAKALLTTLEAAAIIGCTPDTLTTWRCTRAVKVPYVKIGRLVRYRRSDIDAYLDGHTVGADGRQIGAVKP